MLEKLIDEPNWDGMHVCVECGIGISKLTAESCRGDAFLASTKLEIKMLERIKNNYKTIFISSRKEIEEFVSTKIMAIGPNISFSTLEDAILEGMGCGYQTVRLIIYNGISEHGIFLLPENGEFGIELKGDKENSK